MLQFFLWYLLITLTGWLTFPLAYRLLPGLADRGFSLARALGMLAWGYLFWMMASLGLIQNNGSGLLLALIVVAAISAAGMIHKETRRILCSVDQVKPAPDRQRGNTLFPGFWHPGFYTRREPGNCWH